MKRVLGAVLAIVVALPSAALAQATERPTPNELTIFSSAVRRNVLPWLEQQPEYAGAWLDPEVGQLVVSLTEADPAVIAGLDARTPGGREGWCLETTGTTWQELKAATRRAWRVVSKLPGVGQLEASWIDAEEITCATPASSRWTWTPAGRSGCRAPRSTSRTSTSTGSARPSSPCRRSPSARRACWEPDRQRSDGRQVGQAPTRGQFPGPRSVRRLAQRPRPQGKVRA